MREDLLLLMDCQAILLIEGWEMSLGATAEYYVAKVIGLEIFYME